MKLFAIRDESAIEQIDLAYLLYYEVEKRFYIELPENADPWETPLLLSTFIKKGKTSINSYWSKIWVQQRIVPTDRQNLGQVLKDNNLQEYDEFDLLMLSMGRCAQDDYFICRYIPLKQWAFDGSHSPKYQKFMIDEHPLVTDFRQDWNYKDLIPYFEQS